MSFEDQTGFASQVADLNWYGHALNRCKSVEEVVSLTLEVMSLLFETAHSTFVEVRDGELEVVHSTNPALSPGDAPSDTAREAYETRDTIVCDGAAARIDPDSGVTAALAVSAQIVDEVTAVLVARSTSHAEFDDAHVRPMEILASHAATAISNIRSRERLQRAHKDLETRKEMIEMYDRLLRHDLGNDLQVISGFSDALVSRVDGEARDYAERIHRAAESSADLINRVGNLVSTLEDQDELEPRDVRQILIRVVRDNEAQFDDLSIEFDPDAVEYRAFGGELLDSVFDNLVSNAAVHNDGEVTVRIDAETTGGDEVLVTIADDGSGIPPEIRDELFQMGAKDPESTGTGFGLGFVRALTESYGGGVTVTDSEMGGAEFQIRLERV
jgi:signal transduction histidine kinase